MTLLTPLRDDLDSLSTVLSEHLPFSPHDFLRDPTLQAADRAMFAQELTRSLKAEVDLRMRYPLTEGGDLGIFAEILPWDSEFFGYPMARLKALVPLQAPFSIPFADYSAALTAFHAFLRERGVKYMFCVVDSTDLAAIRSMGMTGYVLIEGRLTHHVGLKDYAPAQRFDWRPATPDDLPLLMETARSIVNPFDRFHADPFLDSAKVDRLMELWVEASILRGFADITFVPNLPDPRAFCTARYHRDSWDQLGLKMGQSVFSAIDPRFSGWYTKLITEITCHLRDMGLDHAFVTTQMTSRAAQRACEKMGYHYGKGEYVFRIVL